MCALSLVFVVYPMGVLVNPHFRNGIILALKRCSSGEAAAPCSQLMQTVAPPAMILSMFPYPSGSLHLGHFRIYSISHCIKFDLFFLIYLFRKYKELLLGHSIFHPMGFDSFGKTTINNCCEYI
jgi:leucyl-tRNA synthetase